MLIDQTTLMQVDSLNTCKTDSTKILIYHRSVVLLDHTQCKIRSKIVITFVLGIFLYSVRFPYYTAHA